MTEIRMYIAIDLSWVLVIALSTHTRKIYSQIEILGSVQWYHLHRLNNMFAVTRRTVLVNYFIY